MQQTDPKTFVFVLMPFSEEFTDIYQVGIKPACVDAGAYCERVDEQIFVENILDRVYNQIAKADVIVAEMTGRNPNVFYETGYAHALNKRVVLLTQKAEDIPFDLKHYPHIVYGGKIANLKLQLESRILWCIENPKESFANVDVSLEFFINSVPLIYKPQININVAPTEDSPVEWFRAEINIILHNLTKKVIDHNHFSLAIVAPDVFKFQVGTDAFSSVADLPGKLRVFNIRQTHAIFPDGWNSLEFPLYIRRDHILLSSFEVSLRMFTEFGPKEYPFSIKLHTPKKDSELNKLVVPGAAPSTGAEAT